MFSAGVMDTYAKDKGAYDYSKHAANVTTEASVQLARTLSSASTVLLKNDGGILPLKTSAKLAVIGLADASNALTHSGGSGQVVPSFTATPLSSIKAHVSSAGTVTYDDGSDSTKAAAAAKAAEIAVVFVGCLSHEGCGVRCVLFGGRFD
jgi:beta-glucosidase